jgi:hypothetical protein
MTLEAKLKRLQSYVNERLDLHGDWYGKIQFNKMIEELDDTDLEDTPDIMDMGLNELSIGDE